ncbi:hypothetical protein pb186bvf_003477 [Paramecium bursaria]
MYFFVKMNCILHNQEPYKLICFNLNCKQRILCLRCLINDHNSHPDQCQFIDEILNKEEQINYQFPIIPFQQPEFLNRMIEGFNLAIQSQRSDMLEIQEINYKKTPDVHQFLNNMAKYTNFQEIYVLIQQFVIENTNKQILNQQITEFVQSDDRKQYQEQLYASFIRLRDGEMQKFNQRAVKSITGSLSQQINILQKLTKDLTFNKVMGNKSDVLDNQIIANSADPTAIFISTKIYHCNTDQNVKLTVKSLNLNTNSVFWLGVAYARSSYANFANVQSQIYFQLIQEKNHQDVPGRLVGQKLKEIFQQNPNGMANLEFSFNMKRKRLQISINEISDKLEDGNNKEDQKKVNLGRKLALNTISTYYVIYVKLQYLNTKIEFE